MVKMSGHKTAMHDRDELFSTSVTPVKSGVNEHTADKWLAEYEKHVQLAEVHFCTS